MRSKAEDFLVEILYISIQVLSEVCVCVYTHTHTYVLTYEMFIIQIQ